MADHTSDVLATIPYQNASNEKEAFDYMGSEKKSLDDVEEIDSNNEDIGMLTCLERFFLSHLPADKDNDPAYNVFPQIVRELVDFEDDPNMTVITWRFFFLSGTLTALGA